MIRTIRTTAMAALCCAVASATLVGCHTSDKADSDAASASASATGTSTSSAHKTAAAPLSGLSGARKIRIQGSSVNVSCAGGAADGKPVVVLLAGLGDGLDKLAKFQQSLAAKDRVCSYDRLGEGASDKPKGPQTIDSTSQILTGVLDQVAGDGPVVLVGHSLGGLIAARYAPAHQDRVKGLVLMDATTPTSNADIETAIPKSATGEAAELRAQTLAVDQGQNPENLVIPDAKVASAGSIPTEVIQHGGSYLTDVPTYGPALQRVWSAGEQSWSTISSNSKLSTAPKSSHYIYVDQPAMALQAVERVDTEAAK